MKTTPPLGKSLKDINAKGDDAVSRSVSSFYVDLDRLDVREGFNARPINREHVEEMKTAKRAGAYFPPYVVAVDNGRIEVLAGHHRRTMDLELLEEAKASGDPAHPFAKLRAQCMEFKGNDADQVMLMLGEHEGTPLTPLQAGVQYKKMIGFNWTVQQIAARIGKSDQHVRDGIALASANSDVQGMVERGEVSANTALKVVQKEGSNAGAVLGKAYDEVIAKRASHADTGGGKAGIPKAPKVTAKQLNQTSAKRVLTVKEFDKLLNELCDTPSSHELFDQVCAAFAAAKGAV